MMRNERDALLDVFDLPLFFTSTSSRDTTTSPVQSLLLLNSQIMMNHGLKFADHLQTLSRETHETLQTLWKSALGRLPTHAEVTNSRQFIAEQTAHIAAERKTMELAAVPIGRVPYRDGQAVIIDPRETPLSLGFRTGAEDSFFDGLLDDIRLSSAALPVEPILLTSEKPSPQTEGFWRFEPVPGIF